MATRIVRIITALAFLAISTSAFASESYRISARISDAGEAFAAPELTVKPGTMASVKVAGANAYTLAVAVEPLADGTLRVSTNLESTHGSMAPVLVVKPDVPAFVAVGDLSIALTAAPGGG